MDNELGTIEVGRRVVHSADFGVVILKDWMNNPVTGQQVHAVCGKLTHVLAKDDFGFQPKGNETNWGIRVGTGAFGVLILGCQIRAVYSGREFKTSHVSCWDLRNEDAIPF